MHNCPTHSIGIKLDKIVEYGIFLSKFRTKLPQLIEGYPDLFRKGQRISYKREKLLPLGIVMAIYFTFAHFSTSVTKITRFS